MGRMGWAQQEGTQTNRGFLPLLAASERRYVSTHHVPSRVLSKEADKTRQPSSGAFLLPHSTRPRPVNNNAHVTTAITHLCRAELSEGTLP